MCSAKRLQTTFFGIHSFIHIRVRQVDNRNYTMIKSINIKSYKSNVSLTDYGVKYVKVE